MRMDILTRYGTHVLVSMIEGSLVGVGGSTRRVAV